MPPVLVDDLEVDFPFKPYANQLTYMRSFLQALKSGKNCALEASTGFGKTLCIICLASAFIRRCEEIVNKTRKRVPLTPEEASFAQTTSLFKKDAKSAQGAEPRVPQLIYTSRTHAQLQQVSKQLRGLGLKHIVVGSRNQLCASQECRRFAADCGNNLTQCCKHFQKEERCILNAPAAIDAAANNLKM